MKSYFGKILFIIMIIISISTGTSKYVIYKRDLLRWVFLFLIFVYSLVVVVKRNRKFRFMDIKIMPFLFICNLSLFVSIDKNLSVMRFISFILALMAFNLYLWGMDQNDLKDAFVIFSNIIYIHIFVNLIYIFPSEIMRVLSGVRMEGIFGNSNTLGGFSTIACIISFYRGGQSKKLFNIHYLFFIISILFVAGSYSRMAALTTTIALILMYYNLNCSKSFGFKFLSIFGLGFIICLFFTKNVYLMNRFLEEGGGVNRGGLWNLAIQYIRKRPILGYGFGASQILNIMNPNYWNVLNFHNSYLSLIVDTGFLGMIFFAIYIANQFIDALRVVKKVESITEKIFIKTNIILVFVFLIMGYSETFFISVGSFEGLFFWFFIIMLQRNIYINEKIYKYNK